MGAYDELDEAIAGLKFGVAEPSRVASFKVAELAGIPFGSPVFGYDDDEVNGYLAHTDTSTIVFDADFVTSNSIVITVNGVAGTAVIFATSHAATMTALLVQLESDFTGLTAEATDLAGTNRTIKLVLKGLEIVATEAITGGAGQATGTITASTSQVFLGVALFTQLGYVDNVGYYEYEDAMNVMEIGWIYINTHETVQANTIAYVITAVGATQGKFGTSGFDTGARFRSSVTGAGLARVELRGQKG